MYKELKGKGYLKRIGFEEPLEHVVTVNRYRNYWKPEKVNIILLAESHVRIEEANFRFESDFSKFGLDANYPKNRVNYVYCLGQDREKSQFWKILSASVGNLDFSRFLKSSTPNNED